MEKHISKVNGKIEEIAASEEDEDAGTLDMQGASHDKEDDEEVILTSARLYQKANTTGERNGSNG